MSQVGAPHWNPEVKERINNVFYDVVASIRTRKEARHFCEMLLTSTEKVNLPRRLGIVIMLVAGHDQRTISDKLHVSISTVNRMNIQIKEGLRPLNKYISDIIRENKTTEKIKIARPTYLGGKFKPIELDQETGLPF